MIQLRTVEPSDLDAFFTHQLDPSANQMAAFSAKNPADRGVFNLHWQNLLNDPTITARTITLDGDVVGHVLAYNNDDFPEVSYWIDPSRWSQGITTAALGLFLDEFPQRPIRARAVADNRGSMKVLEKWGFVRVGEAKGFAIARGAVVDEIIMQLD